MGSLSESNRVHGYIREENGRWQVVASHLSMSKSQAESGEVSRSLFVLIVNTQLFDASFVSMILKVESRIKMLQKRDR